MKVEKKNRKALSDINSAEYVATIEIYADRFQLSAQTKNKEKHNGNWL